MPAFLKCSSICQLKGCELVVDCNVLSSHVPLEPSSRPLLFSAAVKLLQFTLNSGSSETSNPAKIVLGHAMYPLLCNPDEHVLPR